MNQPATFTAPATSAAPVTSAAPDTPSAATYGATLLRLSLGVMWIAHALLKWFVFTLPGTAQYFDSIGLPGFLAYVVFAVELAGGVALVLGFYARQIALALVPIMAVAAWVHLPNGWVHTSAGGGWEYPVFLIAASVALWLLGDGAHPVRRSTRFVPAT
ncbi:MAG: DoxX family protein [Burkholderiaceae bacterium]